jgi:alkylation response protein AidB-like acyl-CoA dehydrogenase
MVDDKVVPRAAEIDETEEFPWDLKKIFAEMGLLGLAVPEQYGGTDQGHMFTCLAVEEIARACVSSSLIVQGQVGLGADHDWRRRETKGKVWAYGSLRRCDHLLWTD